MAGPYSSRLTWFFWSNRFEQNCGISIEQYEAHLRKKKSYTMPTSMSRNKLIWCFLENQLCGIVCYQRMVTTARKGLKNKGYSLFVWMILMHI
jgi:hypothetical protein